MRQRLAAALRTHLHNDSAGRRAAWAIVFLLACAVLFATSILPVQVSLRAGQVASTTVLAPTDFIDRPTTNRLRQAAAAQVAPIYDTVSAVQSDVLASFDRDVAVVQSLQASAKTSPADRLTQLRQVVPLPVPDADYQGVLKLSAPVLSTLAGAARTDLATTLARGVKSSTLAASRQTLTQAVDSLAYPAAAAEWFAGLDASLLQANQVVDQTATQAARDSASDAVKPVMILKGQAIVHAGDLVTAGDMVRLQDAGLLRGGGGAIGAALGALVLAALLEGLAWAYLTFFNRDVLQRESRLVLFGLTAVAGLGAIRLALRVSGFLAPLPWAAMLAVVGFDPPLAIFLTLLLSLATGLLSHDLQVGAVSLFLGLVAVFGLRRLQQRSDLMRAGALAGVAGAVASLGLSLFLGGGLAGVAGIHPLIDAGLAVINGLICGMLAIGTLPYLEYGFALLTPMRLMELADPQQPLLRRLLLEAPGTYHHSLMVANLAEAACEAVGGDPLLARVGAYYHDVGKVKRPYFFVENQMGAENPHDKLSPNLSALVITSHVKDGVELAREHRLPEELVEFIRTHHGTTLVSYFYHRARQAGECIEDNFRYDGPVPETREQAVVMLADGVEATVRAMRETQPDKLEATIRNIVKERLDSGQLARADLTLGQLDRIVSTFIHVLGGVYHRRVEYPEQIVRDFPPRRAVGS